MDPLPLLHLREPVSSLTHLATAVFAVYVTLLFARLTRDEPAKRSALLVFGLAMVVLYTASGVYHAVPGRKLDPLVCEFRRLDVSAIFLLIAGTFTPIVAVLLTDPRRRVMLTVLWSLAAAGIASRWLLPRMPHPLTVCTFVAAGLPGFLPMRQYVKAVGPRAFGWGLGGAACYALGGICDVFDWPTPIPGLINSHELTHLLDMAGTGCHVIFMLRFVVPFERPVVRHRRVRLRLAEPALAANV
jgi:hemolysin III